MVSEWCKNNNAALNEQQKVNLTIKQIAFKKVDMRSIWYRFNCSLQLTDNELISLFVFLRLILLIFLRVNGYKDGTLNLISNHNYCFLMIYVISIFSFVIFVPLGCE